MNDDVPGAWPSSGFVHYVRPRLSQPLRRGRGDENPPGSSTPRRASSSTSPWKSTADTTDA